MGFPADINEDAEDNGFFADNGSFISARLSVAIKK